MGWAAVWCSAAVSAVAGAARVDQFRVGKLARAFSQEPDMTIFWRGVIAVANAMLRAAGVREAGQGNAPVE